MGFFEEEKPKRPRISKSEWEAIKTSHGNKCVLCGKTERAVGELQKAHIKAESRGGSQVVPMCPTCHKKFDKGLASATQLKKLGLTMAQYSRMMPKSGSKKRKRDMGYKGFLALLGKKQQSPRKRQ